MKPLSSLLLWPFRTLWDMVTEPVPDEAVVFRFPSDSDNLNGAAYEYLEVHEERQRSLGDDAS